MESLKIGFFAGNLFTENVWEGWRMLQLILPRSSPGIILPTDKRNIFISDILKPPNIFGVLYHVPPIRKLLIDYVITRSFTRAVSIMCP